MLDMDRLRSSSISDAHAASNLPKAVGRATAAVALLLISLLAGCGQVNESAYDVDGEDLPRASQHQFLPPEIMERPALKFQPPVATSPRVEITEFTVGASSKGEKITMTVFGSGSETTLIFGGMHGNEPTSAELAQRLVKHLRDNPDLCGDRCIVVLPRLNPDGLDAGTRTNANGVDLNRNFPARNWRHVADGPSFGGTKAGSETETQALLEVVRLVEPSRIVAIHSIARGRHCNNFDGPAKSLAEAMGRHNRYPVKASIGYPTPGSFGTWAGVERKIPTITLELPRDADPDECWRDNRDALLAAIRGANESSSDDLGE
jgi:protein MpaA